MRKIEQQMIAAINERRDWRLDNTEVQVVNFPHGETTIDKIYVRLHGSTIAIITPDELDISDCSWQTPTTKSRLNAILTHFCGCDAGITQKNHVWYLCKYDGTISKDEIVKEMQRGSRHVLPRN